MNIHFGSKADPFAKKRFSIASFETVKIDYAKLPPGRLFGRPINLTCVESSFCDLCYEIENEKIVRTWQVKNNKAFRDRNE